MKNEPEILIDGDIEKLKADLEEMRLRAEERKAFRSKFGTHYYYSIPLQHLFFFLSFSLSLFSASYHFCENRTKSKRRCLRVFIIPLIIFHSFHLNPFFKMT